jgi:Uri superfamily endonuclease
MVCWPCIATKFAQSCKVLVLATEELISAAFFSENHIQSFGFLDLACHSCLRKTLECQISQSLEMNHRYQLKILAKSKKEIEYSSIR